MAEFEKSTVYQIYPKSFCDSNGDGFGDLRGVIEKLDYIRELGVDYIWLTPVYVSPQKDNGYDVEDYCSIDPRYGTMEDFELLVKEAGRRGIKVMLDMVFNHTSSRHVWFQRALAGDETYKKYYFFRKGEKPPTNWQSKFGGDAWEYVPQLGEYYLHLFDVTQPDLNWDNEEVRAEIQNVVRFWMKKGVKGFRFDVVNLISKAGFEDDAEGGDGRRFYTDGPNIHKYLRELNEQTFGQDVDIVTVGEMSSTSMENCFQYAGKNSHELSMVFQFHHLKVDFVGNDKWVLVPPDFEKLKQILFSWQVGMAEHDAWNALFWCNHDQPRVVSRFGDENLYWKQSAKMLATVMHGMRGTPYIYQGEELGMTNAGFTDISQYRDVESLNHFRILQEKGISEQDAYQILQAHSRDNSRTPMQWNAGKHGGFTEGTPWIEGNPNCVRINAAEQMQDADSVFHYYQKLVLLRKEYDVIAYGDFEPVDEKNPSVIAYRRTYKHESENKEKKEQLLVAANFYGQTIEWDSKMDLSGYACLAGNYPDVEYADLCGQVLKLRPYEAVMLYKKEE
ncbi:MAG: alpha,alpha-phosphotrehalase [bacterium]|nr:alpha,alpha-phosphotrehalase [bacterium]